jgi:hypothetical protein
VIIPRFRIAQIMAVVAIAALDFGIVQALFRIAAHSNNGRVGAFVWPLILGALPMANILAVGLLIGYRRRASQPFLWGFEMFGATALFLYICNMGIFNAITHKCLGSIARVALVNHSLWALLLVFSLEVVMLGLPQLVFALLGGLLYRKFS